MYTYIYIYVRMYIHTYLRKHLPFQILGSGGSDLPNAINETTVSKRVHTAHTPTC